MQPEKTEFQSPITKEWYGKAQRFVPVEGINYGWVWDYAKFRFEWACGNGRYVEDKAMSLFKFLLTIVAFIGASISFLVAQHVTLTSASYVCGLLTVGTLALAAVCLLKTFDPADHLYPVEEEAALLCSSNAKEDGRANMSLAMTASIEFERTSISGKAKWLKWGLGMACTSIILFILSLLLLVSP
jgi:hypothetical protein